MKELIFEKQDTQAGNVRVTMRILGKIIFLKTNNQQYSKQLIDQMRSKGAIINEARGWMRVNIFGNNEYVKINGKEFNAKEESEERVENILEDFYTINYLKAGFKMV